MSEIITFKITDEMMLKVYGVETMDEVRAIQKEGNKLWCQDLEGHEKFSSRYIPDTKKMKHHWVCNKCGKITQIG